MPEQPRQPDQRNGSPRRRQPAVPSDPTRMHNQPVSNSPFEENPASKGRSRKGEPEALIEKPLNADYWYGVPNAPYQKVESEEKAAAWRINIFRMLNEGCSVHVVAFMLANLVSCGILGLASYSSFGQIQSPNLGATGLFIGTTILWTLFTNQMRVLLATAGANGAELVSSIVSIIQQVVYVPYAPGQEEQLVARLFSAGLDLASRTLGVTYSSANEQQVAAVLLQPSWLFVLLGVFFALVIGIAAFRAIRGPRPRWVYFLGMTFGFWAFLTMSCYGVTLAAALLINNG